MSIKLILKREYTKSDDAITHPEDNGCKVANSCISCPLSECLYVLSKSARGFLRNHNVIEQVFRNSDKGLSLESISEATGIPRATVVSWLNNRSRIVRLINTYSDLIPYLEKGVNDG